MPRRPAIRFAVLAGGSGTRFWPAGRRSMPKQLLALDGDDPTPLLRLTLDRIDGLGEAPPWIVAPKALARPIRRLLDDLTDDAWLWEPRPRNTAAAVVLAALAGAQVDPETPVVALPADHHVQPAGRYRTALKSMAARAAEADAILTLGLVPDHPATGYGYLRVGEERARARGGTIYRVDRFIEKPSASRARRLVRDGRHLWNGGTFAFRPEVLLAEARRHLPEVLGPLEAAFEARGTPRFTRALSRAYDQIPSISVDYGIMERTERIEVLASDVGWDDLGSWDAVARHRRADGAGNRLRGDVTVVDAEDCVVDAASGHVALLGVKDLIVVRVKDTVLVAKRGRGEDVRRVVERLEAEGRTDLLR